MEVEEEVQDESVHETNQDYLVGHLQLAPQIDHPNNMHHAPNILAEQRDQDNLTHQNIQSQSTKIMGPSVLGEEAPPIIPEQQRQVEMAGQQDQLELHTQLGMLVDRLQVDVQNQPTQGTFDQAANEIQLGLLSQQALGQIQDNGIPETTQVIQQLHPLTQDKQGHRIPEDYEVLNAMVADNIQIQPSPTKTALMSLEEGEPQTTNVDATRLWARFFSLGNSSHLHVSNPVEWVNFFTVQLLQPESFVWFRQLLSSKLPLLLSEPSTGSVEFSVPLHCPDRKLTCLLSLEEDTFSVGSATGNKNEAPPKKRRSKGPRS